MVTINFTSTRNAHRWVLFSVFISLMSTVQSTLHRFLRWVFFLKTLRLVPFFVCYMFFIRSNVLSKIPSLLIATVAILERTGLFTVVEMNYRVLVSNIVGLVTGRLRRHMGKLASYFGCYIQNLKIK